MNDLIPAVIGVAVMAAFAGGLIWLIGALPLVIITALVLVMVVTDAVRTLREQRRDAGS
jgi:energy-converting hydrogenase Eha subunit H